MKIAITGHSYGIGKEFYEQLNNRGHDVIGLSRSSGENIRRINHITNLITPCDLFINNAQESFAQTELLFNVWEKWQGQKKYIWNISTMMVENPVYQSVEGFSKTDMTKYRNQKYSLEESSRQLRYLNQWPLITIIRPGKVNTQNSGGVDVSIWVKNIINIFHNTNQHNCKITEISLGPSNGEFII